MERLSRDEGETSDPGASPIRSGRLKAAFASDAAWMNYLPAVVFLFLARRIANPYFYQNAVLAPLQIRDDRIVIRGEAPPDPLPQKGGPWYGALGSDQDVVDPRPRKARPPVE